MEKLEIADLGFNEATTKELEKLEAIRDHIAELIFEKADTEEIKAAIRESVKIMDSIKKEQNNENN